MEKKVEPFIIDTLIERPHAFTVEIRENGTSLRKKVFFIYPMTLGKMFILQPLIERLEINTDNLRDNVSVEILRVVHQKREESLTIIAYQTCRGRDEALDAFFVEERKKLFDKHLSESDIATLLLAAISPDRLEKIVKHYGIDREQDDLRQVMRAKEKAGKNNLSFGGKSLYGTLIHPLLEVGLTWNEIVWERSYANLKLLLLDKMTSVYVTDEELKNIPANIRNRDDEVIMSTKENMETILKMGWR